jgi:hypothetical protein
MPLNALRYRLPLARNLHLSPRLRLRGTVGCDLADLQGSDSFPVAPVAPAAKKRGLMPLLTVVFLGSYGLMTMLIVEQGETIQSQRNLIQVLLGDSRELWSMKGKALSDKASHSQSRAEAPLGQSTSGQTGSKQTPSRQAPSVQTPSNQVPANQPPQGGAAKASKPDSQTPHKVPQTQLPPVPASEWGDQRRVLITL